jgi:pyruvate-ferredoxin/flavodoxin oxidoreductase
VLSTHHDVNVLVLDTEVYSNTGGQQSKATPLGAAAKFAAAGKESAKKDLGMMPMSYGHVYIARIAFGAKDNHTVQALLEAEAYPGPSLVIAYSHCIAHGYDMALGAEQQKLAVASGIWPLYRYDPRRAARGEPPLLLDSPEPKVPAREYMRNETRFRMVEKQNPERFRRLLAKAEREARQRYAVYRQLAGLTIPLVSANEDDPAPVAAAD